MSKENQIHSVPSQSSFVLARKIQCVLALCVMTLLCLSLLTPSVLADEKSDRFKSEISAAKEKLQQTKNDIESLHSQSVAIKQKIQALELENEELLVEKEKIIAQVAEATETMLQRQEEEAQARERVIIKQEEYQLRISKMFYFKQRDPLEILLETKGLEGFFSNMRMIQAIAQADAKLLTELKLAEDESHAAAELAAKTKAAFDQFLEEKLQEIELLEQGISIAKKEAAALDQLLTNRTMELADVEKEIRQKEAAFQAYQNALSRYSGQIAKLNPAGHNAVWPLPSSQQIYSPYGYRNLGFDRANGYLHTGTDFAGPNVAGAPVVAAWEGIVVNVHLPYPGQMYAPDANYVQISHGNGLGTGYWHLMNATVVAGQHVAKGEIIGYCGSTGMSTGPHLHFEVYDETNPQRGLRNTVDPMLYLGG